MKTYECNSIAEFYKLISADLINAPEVSPSGKKTKEIICPQILLKNPRNRIAHNTERKFSINYALVESLLLFNNTNKLKYFSLHNENIINFSDDGEHLFGSYGFRIADSIKSILDKLKNDKETRQAVLPILSINDINTITKDTPCTLSLQFIIRDNKLNMICNMRSNDIMWGIPYDIFMFTVLQEIIANTLGIELGWYLHRPASLHLYDYHYELFEKVANDLENIYVSLPYDIKDWTAISIDYIESIDQNNTWDWIKYLRIKHIKISGDNKC